jgi:hypothetical protein
MTFPHLTFFCELESEPLEQLLTQEVLRELAALQAGISLGILDFSPARAEVVHRLNQAGIPVTAWLLLSKDQGYWFNLDNAPQATARYADFKAWTVENHLLWAGIGFDIEPDIRELELWTRDRRRLVSILLRRVFNFKRLRTARSAYTRLISEIHIDGYEVESYQFPVIADERLTGSTLLQRLAGVVDLPVDREVLMLYTSFLRPSGAGLLCSYGPEAQAIGLGSTGGGVDVGILDARPLEWEELARDLRLAWYYKDQIYVFSLEGCVRQGFLPLLKSFQWDVPILMPDTVTQRVRAWRETLQTTLWVGAHILHLLVAAAGLFLVIVGLRRRFKRARSEMI